MRKILSPNNEPITTLLHCTVGIIRYIMLDLSSVIFINTRVKFWTLIMCQITYIPSKYIASDRWQKYNIIFLSIEPHSDDLVKLTYFPPFLKFS